MSDWRSTTETVVEQDEPLPVGYLLQGEALPGPVVASMWVEAIAASPGQAIFGLGRVVAEWREAGGWEIEDGKVQVEMCPPDGYRASVVVTKAVKW